MEQRTSLTEIIEYIDPGSLNYQDWVNVGMALKLEGYPVSVWDQWSQKDFGRYHAGECEKFFRFLLSGNWWDYCTDGNGARMGAGKRP